METGLKRKHFIEYKTQVENVLTVERCAQMVNQGNVSVRGYDRMNNVMRKNWISEKDGHEEILIDVGDGQPGVPMPRFTCGKTIRKHREAECRAIGVRPLTEDGSAVQMYSFIDDIRRQLIMCDKEWCIGRKIEVLFSGDAHCTLKRRKMTHFCLRIIGATANDNSPDSLWGLVHYEGSDDWDSMKEQCVGIVGCMESIVAAGGKLDVLFDGESVTCDLDLIFCADGALLDGEQVCSNKSSRSTS